MAKTLAQLNAEIEKLQRQADALQSKEVAEVIARIREAIDHYGLTAADLGLDGSPSAEVGQRPASKVKVVKAPTARPVARKARKSTRAERGNSAARPARAKRSIGVIKYRDEAGNAWTGHGKRPNWFKDALESGKTLEDLAVNS